MGLIRFLAIPTNEARAFQRGEPDAYGRAPERRISDGSDIPCRHCLRHVEADHAYLVLAYRPFPTLQPYAETGPVFLHADACERAPESDVLSPMFRVTPDYILRGYGKDDRIVYGTGGVIATHKICGRAHELFKRDDVAYIHMRSARNNCYQVRSERDERPTSSPAA